MPRAKLLSPTDDPYPCVALEVSVPMESKFEPLVDGNIAVSLPENMFKLQELEAYTQEAFKQEGLNHLGRQLWDSGRGRFPVKHPEQGRSAWFSEGWDCEILKPTAGFWQKGKIRIKVTYEFCPEESTTEKSELNGLRGNLLFD